MINRYLYYSFRFIWSLGCSSGVIPFDYDLRSNKMYPTKWLHKKVLSRVALVIFFFRMVVLGVKLVIALGDWKSNIAQVCMLGFYESIFLHSFLVQLNLWRKGSSVCWIFNQVTEMADLGKLRKHVKPPEMVMLTWVPGHVDICWTLTMAFIKAPAMNHNLFSDLPLEMQEDPLVFKFFAVLEGLSFIFFYPTTLFEFSIQTFYIKAFIHLTAEIQHGMEDRITFQRFEQLMKLYRELKIALETFIYVYGRTIERIKTVFTIHTVMCSFFLIRWHSLLSPQIFGFVVNVGSFTGTLPPLLYNSAFRVHSNSCEVKVAGLLSINHIPREDHRQVCRKELRSLKPLAIRVAGMYFLDRSLTPLFYKILFDSTCNMLVSTR